ncbi:hypothetical protein [Flavobacterium oreochromis]|uniref:hypothetical protein n=1 Tax=Flavobacterium oreochromis TaxID=2906078 RepID=UPI00385E3834
MKPIYTTIPIELCLFALKNRKVNEVKLHIYLKHISSGHIKMNYNMYDVWAVDLELSPRTIRKCFEWLIKNKWITVNSKTNSYRLISYSQINRKQGFKSRKSVIFESDFKLFQNFCCAAMVTYYIRRKNFTDRKKRSVPIMVGTSMNRNSCLKRFTQMPVAYLANCFSVSNKTAFSYKQKAKETGFIEVKKQQSYLNDDNGNKISSDKLIVFKKVTPEKAGRLRTKNGKIVIVESDMIKSTLIMKSKRLKNNEKK